MKADPVGSEEGSAVLRFLGPLLVGSSTVVSGRSLALALEAVDIFPERLGALGSHMADPISADSVGREGGSSVLRFIGPFLLGFATEVSGR